MDYQGIYFGKGFVVEAKAEAGALTKRQKLSLRAVLDAGGWAFVVTGADREAPGWSDLRRWLDERMVLPPGLYGYPVEKLELEQLDT